MWRERTIRGNPARLRNARELTAELALVLDEMAEMGPEDRRAAYGHQGHAVRLLGAIREQVGPLGEDPARREERIRDMVREHTTNGSSRP